MPFSKEEVFYVLLKLNEAKGPRWVLYSLLVNMLGLYEKGGLSLFKEFFLLEKVLKSLNATFLMLIPKKGEKS